MTTVSDDVEMALAAGRWVAYIPHRWWHERFLGDLWQVHIGVRSHPTHKDRYPTLHALYAWGKMSALIALCTVKVRLYTVMYY